jgi:hypothetical protein
VALSRDDAAALYPVATRDRQLDTDMWALPMDGSARSPPAQPQGRGLTVTNPARLFLARRSLSVRAILPLASCGPPTQGGTSYPTRPGLAVVAFVRTLCSPAFHFFSFSSR